MQSIAAIEQIIEPALTRLGLIMHCAELKREGRELVLHVVVDKADKKSQPTASLLMNSRLQAMK